MITFMDSREVLKEGERCLDSQLWHACAGSMIQMPPVNSKVYYFPQGHAEHASGNVDFRDRSGLSRVPAWVPCRVAAVKFMADVDTDEVYAKIRLVPVSGSGEFSSFDDEDSGSRAGTDSGPAKPSSFAKTLTQSDVNNGGGFSVPRYCAETIFPRLDYSADPPVQTILAKDVHSDTWKFRHIYRGTPRRHLLTTGWSTFVNHKKLVAGDSIVFLRAENGDLCVGIRRAKRGIGGGPETSSGWNPAGGNCSVPYGGYSSLIRNGDGGGGGDSFGKVKVEADSVIQAVKQATSGQPFEVEFYPRASTPEFCVKASLVKNAMQIRWSPGMRFKMPFETEDSSRISWFMGTITSVQVADPIRWPDSPWRLLQVTWDEPDLLQNVKRVNPWLVELVSTMPAIHMSPFSPPRKKCRPTQHPDYHTEPQIPIPIPAFSRPHPHLFGGPTTGLFGYQLPENLNHLHHPASMQGARHTHYGLSLSDIQINTKPNPSFSPNPSFNKPAQSEPISCLLTIGNSTTSSKEPETPETPKVTKTSRFILFGQPILTEQQIVSGSGSGRETGLGQTLNAETGHCKVFMESEDVGRTLDLSLLDSYEELCKKLGIMFEIERPVTPKRVHYWDSKGTLKQIGDEPFGEFMKTARRLTISTDLSNVKDLDS
ncbi:auxin response factor 18-like [Bidens hawaiensis]|uniref:auxin response factor 18-like n=1 Tax=Bidens hawaiensis TaxID=980011 RepID=UPI00404B72AC